jgi:hypothetical protein
LARGRVYGRADCYLAELLRVSLEERTDAELHPERENVSSHTNLRRKKIKRTETGPRFESKNPGAGSNSTHVARSRKKWKRRAARTERRTGKTFYKYHGTIRRRPGGVVMPAGWSVPTLSALQWTGPFEDCVARIWQWVWV